MENWELNAVINMKKGITFFLLTLFFNNVKAQDTVQIDSVHTLVLKNYQKLDSVFKDCELHYAMIKLEINKNNQINNVSSLNPISDEFLSLFKPLEHMNFPVKKEEKKTILFIYVVYPRRVCEISKGESYARISLHTFLPEISANLVKQIRANPKTIYYDGIIYSYPEYKETRTHNGKKVN